MLRCPLPVVLGQGHDGSAIEIAVGPEVQILNGGGESQAGGFQAVVEAPVIEGGHLAIDQEAEALLEREICQVRAAQLFRESLGHGGELHGVEFLDSGLGQHQGCVLSS